jgi:hypothetical protein
VTVGLGGGNLKRFFLSELKREIELIRNEVMRVRYKIHIA